MGDKVRYFQHPGGAVSELTATAGRPVLMPEGTREISEKTYRRKLAVLQAQAHEQAAAIEEEGLRQRRGDYEALLGVGMPEESARRMSRYQGDPDTAPGDQDVSA